MLVMAAMVAAGLSPPRWALVMWAGWWAGGGTVARSVAVEVVTGEVCGEAL